MNIELQEQVIGKLDHAYPGSADWIFRRCDSIMDELELYSGARRESFNAGVNTVLSPLSASFWKSTIQGMGRIIGAFATQKDYREAIKDSMPKRRQNSISRVMNSIALLEKSIVLAANDYIERNNVPTDIFTEEELAYLHQYDRQSAEQTHTPETGL